MLDIDWSKVPEGYDWVAQDEHGCIHVFINKPFPSEGEFGAWVCRNGRVFLCRRKPNKNWRDTLTKRPVSETQSPDVEAHEPEADPAEEPKWEICQGDPSEMADRYRDARIRESFAVIMAELPALLEDREKLRKLTGVLG